MKVRLFVLGAVALIILAVAGAGLLRRPGAGTRVNAKHAWEIGTPIVTYFAGPTMSEAMAAQMGDGGFNAVWCREQDLDLLQRHGLRGMLQDELLTAGSLDSPDKLAKLDALVDRVRRHEALYAYFITDEPSAGNFPGLGKLVAHLKERDPAHLAYINLLPDYASSERLGTTGDRVAAYEQYLRQFMDVVKPALVSWDHYQFYKSGDSGVFPEHGARSTRGAGGECAVSEHHPGLFMGTRRTRPDGG